MIETAVQGQPDDGYITDSLGWVLYRLGRYEEAVTPMLRAVELTPDDPVINDHLGDVLWMVGRKREAEFQWRRALSFGPADDLDMDRIRKKLEVGLDKVLADRPEAGRLSRGVTAAPRRSSRPPRSTSRCTSPAAAPTAITCSTASWSSPRIGDLVEAEPAAGLSLAIDGPFAGDLDAGAGQPRAARGGAAPRRGPRRGAAADQGAAGRQRHRRRLGRRRGDAAAAGPALGRAAARRRRRCSALGADVPVCLAGAACRMRGDRRGARARSPCRRFWLVLANPGVPVADRRRSSPASPRRDNPPLPEPAAPCPTPRRSPAGSPPSATTSRRPAIAVAPAIAEALAALAAQPGCRLARMSGSGATCFGLFAAEPPAARRRPPAEPCWRVAARPWWVARAASAS